MEKKIDETAIEFKNAFKYIIYRFTVLTHIAKEYGTTQSHILYDYSKNYDSIIYNSFRKGEKTQEIAKKIINFEKKIDFFES